MKLFIKFGWLPLMALVIVASFDLKFDLVGLTFATLAAQSIFGLSWTFSRKITLLTIFFVFAVVFFAFIPWLHYSGGHVIWRAQSISDESYIVTNAAIFLANLIVLLAYVFFFKKSVLLSMGCP